MTKPKQCLICGDWFTPKANSQRLCGKVHTRKCVICGKEFVIKSSATPTQTCSTKCTAKLREQTMMKRYGVAFSMQSEVFQKKSEETQLKKYGVKHAAQNEEIKEKTRKHFIEKFGGPSPFCNPEFLAKVKKNNLEKYGYEFPMARPEQIARIKQTNLKKYGCEYPLGNPDINKAFTDRMYRKYGVPYYYMSQDCINRRKLPIPHANSAFNERLKAIGVEASFEFPIDRYLYDLHVVGSNMLVEIDPIVSHNTYWSPWHARNTPMNYHVGKSQTALDHGYMCIHIWDWDDKDLLVKVFFGAKSKIHARKCKLMLVGLSELNTFESENYLLNYSYTPDITYGLYYEDKLVYTMSFQKLNNSKYGWKLLRMCSAAEYRVVGGASKLFKYFLKVHSPKSVVAYCDDSKFTGNVARYLGMKVVGHTDPECLWGLEGTNCVIPQNILDGGTSNQICRVPDGDSLDNYNEEWMQEHLEDHTWLPVYNCGNTIFEYVKK